MNGVEVGGVTADGILEVLSLVDDAGDESPQGSYRFQCCAWGGRSCIISFVAGEMETHSDEQ